MEAKEETPKSNVRNTTRAETRVKRCSRNADKGGGGGTAEIFGTLNSRRRKARDIGARSAE